MPPLLRLGHVLLLEPIREPLASHPGEIVLDGDDPSRRTRLEGKSASRPDRHVAKVGFGVEVKDHGERHKDEVDEFAGVDGSELAASMDEVGLDQLPFDDPTGFGRQGEQREHHRGDHATISETGPRLSTNRSDS